MIKKPCIYFKNLSSIYFFCIVLFVVALFNSFCHVGLLEDGFHNFWQAITCDNPLLGHEPTNAFPYNSRYFPTLIQHAFPAIAASAGITSIKVLLFLFTFLIYSSPILFIVLIYLNIPENKRENFEFAVLAFVICLLYMYPQLCAEVFITGLFLWIVFSIYFYADFNNLSKINKISLFVFPFILISSHPATAVTGALILIFGIVKYLYTKKNKNNFYAIISFIILAIAIIFNTYFIIHPLVPGTGYKLDALKNIHFAVFSFSILSLIYLSTKKKGYLTAVCIFIISAITAYITLFKIPTNLSYNYRVLGFIIPLFFIILIIVSDFFKIKFNFRIIKIINFLVITIFLINTLYYGTAWKNYLNSFSQHMFKNKEIILENKNSFYPDALQNNYELHFDYSLPFIALLLPPLYNQKSACLIKVKMVMKGTVEEVAWARILVAIFKWQTIDSKDKLLKYSINIDKYFRIIELS